MNRLWVAKWNDEMAQENSWEDITEASTAFDVDLSLPNVFVWHNDVDELEDNELEAIGSMHCIVCDYAMGKSYHQEVNAKIVRFDVSEHNAILVLIEVEGTLFL